MVYKIQWYPHTPVYITIFLRAGNYNYIIRLGTVLTELKSLRRSRQCPTCPVAGRSS